MVVVTLNQANLTASTKTGNLLANTDLAFMPYDGSVDVYAVSSAAGVNIELGVGNEKAISDREIVCLGTTLLDDHLIASFTAVVGSPLSLFLRETAAAATTDVLLKIEVEAI